MTRLTAGRTTRARAARLVVVAWTIAAGCSAPPAPADGGTDACRDGGPPAPVDAGPTSCGTTGLTCTAAEICVFPSQDLDAGRPPDGPHCAPRPAGCNPVDCMLLECCPWSACISTLCPSSFGCGYTWVHDGAMYCE
jgi:hypothetical protein